MKTVRSFSSILLVALFIGLSFSAHGQDVEQLLQKAKGFKKLKEQIKKDPIKLTGGFNARFDFNAITGIPRRTNPYNMLLSANFNLNILKHINIPFSLNYSNGRTVYQYRLPSYRLPQFALFGISPSYKWGTLHIGNRSLTFSPYTLSGHSFYGIGTELRPGNFRFSAMYGRLQRAVAEDLNSLQSIDPTYKRMGWGVKIGYDDGRDNIYLMVFRGWDDKNSIPPVQENLFITPADNMIVSFSGKKSFGKYFYFASEWAGSALTRDAFAPSIDSLDVGFLKSYGGLFNINNTSGFYNAFKNSIGLNLKFGNIQVNHEWVDPGYRTLGALFFNNDFENWTVSTKTDLLQRKVVLTANVGIQRNDLRGTEANNAKRFIGSLNATVSPTDRININASYSNFRTTNKMRAVTLPVVPIDSIILSQVSQNASLSGTYAAGEQKNSMYSALFSFSRSNSIENDEVRADQLTSNYLANLMHTYVFMDSKLTLSTSLMANYNNIPLLNILSLSPSFSLSKPFLEDKMKLTAATSFVNIATNGKFTNSIWSLQSNLQYTILKKHDFGLSISLVNRRVKNESPGAEGFTEFNGGLTYRWRFK